MDAYYFRILFSALTLTWDCSVEMFIDSLEASHFSNSKLLIKPSSFIFQAYSVSNNFRYPQYLFFVNGWYNDRWWVGSEEEQTELIRKYNCDAAQRESLLPSTLAPATSGRTVLNYSVVADNGYVSGIV